MTEREAIVAWLRGEAEWNLKEASRVAKFHGYESAAHHERRSNFLANLAVAIERGDHLPERTGE